MSEPNSPLLPHGGYENLRRCKVAEAVYGDDERRKAPQAALKEREELVRTQALLRDTILQATQPMALMSSKDLTFMIINKAAEDFLMIDAADYIGKSPEDIDITWQEYAPDGRRFEVDELPTARGLRGLATYGLEHRTVRRDGSELWGMSSGTPIYDSTGNQIAVLLMIQDITGRKRAEAEAAYRGAFLEAISEISGRFLMTAATTQDDAIDFSLQRLCRLLAVDRAYVFGFSDDMARMTNSHEWCEEGIAPQMARIQNVQTDTMPWWKAQISQRNPIHIPAVAALPAEARAERDEFEAQGIQSMLCLFLVDSKGDVIGFVGFDAVRKARFWSEQEIEMLQVAADMLASVIARNQAEEALRRRDTLQRKLISNIGDVIVIIDASGINRFKSDNIEKFFGWKPDEVVGESALANVHPDDLRNAQAFIMDLLQKPGSTGTIECRYRCKDNTYKWISFTGSNLLHDPDIQGILGNYCDISEKKHTQKRLEAFAAVAKNSNNIVVVKDLDLRVVVTNQAFADVAGHSSVDTMIGKTDAEIFGVPADVEPIRSYMQDDRYAQTLSPGQYIQKEEPVMGPDGHVQTVLTKKYPVFGDSGELIGTGNISVDITERKEMQRELEERNEQFALAIAGTNDGIWDWNLKTGELYLSPRWKQIIGYGADELEQTYSMFESLVHEGDRDRVRAYVQQYLCGGVKNYEIEFRMLHKDGSIRWILAKGTALRDQDGKPYRMAGSHSDITTRKMLEDALLLFRYAVEQSAACIVITDLVGRIEYVNAAFTRQTGYLPEEAIGRNPRLLKSGTFPSEYYKPLWSTLLAGDEWFGEMHNKRKDGSLYWESAHISPVRDKDGKMQHFLAIKEDITVRKQAEDQLRRMNMELEQATRRANNMAAQAELASLAKSEFLANMSHEIRTPMNGVIGMTELLLDTPLDDDQRRYAEIVKHSGEALLAVINDILDFSKIEAGKLEMERVDFNLRDMLEVAVGMLQAKADEKGLAFKCVTEPDVPDRFSGDAARLRQVLVNLVGNAIKFTERGQVAVRVATTGGACRTGGTDEAVACLRFSVTDTGIGIPTDKRGRLFQQFSQVDGSTTRRYGGTGLGLAISKQLVELMGGEIGVESEAGNGSEFWFTVPLRLVGAGTGSGINEEERLEMYLTTGAFASCDAQVLLAEDDATNRAVALGILKKLGITRVDLAEDGTGVLEALSRKPYDLILMDVQMPGMDGLEATRRIRRQTADRRPQTGEQEVGGQKTDPGNKEQATKNEERIPIIAMTAHAMQGDRAKVLDAGMDDYVTKPISAKVLAGVLARWLPGGGNGIGQESLVMGQESAVGGLPSAVSPVVWDRAGMLDRIMGDLRLARLLMDGFLGDMPLQFTLLREALASGDASRVERQAHKIKGAAANVGCEALRALALELEQLARQGLLDAGESRLAALDTAFDQVRQAVDGRPL
jgi:PAS domain S-box-containing protein